MKIKINKKSKKETEPKVRKLTASESWFERMNPWLITLGPDEYKVLS